MNIYLVPANTKKSTLIFGFMRWIDLLILSIGVVITVLLVAIFGGTNSTLMLILFCIPAGICGLLVVPIPNYHNVRGFLRSMINYISGRKQYFWKGWCVKDVYGRDYESRFNK